jgi:hypothetical protein
MMGQETGIFIHRFWSFIGLDLPWKEYILDPSELPFRHAAQILLALKSPQAGRQVSDT